MNISILVCGCVGYAGKILQALMQVIMQLDSLGIASFWLLDKRCRNLGFQPRTFKYTIKIKCLMRLELLFGLQSGRWSYNNMGGKLVIKKYMGGRLVISKKMGGRLVICRIK